MEFGEKLGDQASRTGCEGHRRKGLETLHPVRAGRAGQVVDAEVEGGLEERDRPLERDGDVPRGGDGAQQQGSVDVVVVGDGDEPGKLGLLLDLVALEIEGETGRQGWRPVAFGVIWLDAR